MQKFINGRNRGKPRDFLNYTRRTLFIFFWNIFITFYEVKTHTVRLVSVTFYFMYFILRLFSYNSFSHSEFLFSFLIFPPSMSILRFPFITSSPSPAHGGSVHHLVAVPCRYIIGVYEAVHMRERGGFLERQ